jgi:hypothetical protein
VFDGVCVQSEQSIEQVNEAGYKSAGQGDSYYFSLLAPLRATCMLILVQ